MLLRPTRINLLYGTPHKVLYKILHQQANNPADHSYSLKGRMVTLWRLLMSRDIRFTRSSVCNLEVEVPCVLNFTFENPHSLRLWEDIYFDLSLYPVLYTTDRRTRRTRSRTSRALDSGILTGKTRLTLRYTQAHFSIQQQQSHHVGQRPRL